MKNVFRKPGWQPSLPKGICVLVTGATGGLGKSLITMLLQNSDCVIGAHGSTKEFKSESDRIISLRKTFDSEASCCQLIDKFVHKAGRIDALIVLSGSIQYSGHWIDMGSKEWEKEIEINLHHPFYLARRAMKHMVSSKSGGRIIFTGTESALHGGSVNSFPYAIAKRGTECLVQGMAREGASDNILVNGVRLGYIASGFHQRWHNSTKKEMRDRAELVPLKRGGSPDEVAAFVIYLLSEYGSFITGQMLPITGGDWL